MDEEELPYYADEMHVKFDLGGAKLGGCVSGTIREVPNSSVGCCVVNWISDFLQVNVEEIFNEGRKRFYLQAVSLNGVGHFNLNATVPLRLFDSCRESVAFCKEMAGVSLKAKVSILTLVLKETNEEPWSWDGEMAEAWSNVQDDRNEVFKQFHYFTKYNCCSSTVEKCFCWKMRNVYRKWIFVHFKSGCQRFLYPVDNEPRCVEMPGCDKPQTNWFQEYEYFERTRCVPDEGCPDKGCYACYIIQEELRYRVVREVADPVLVGRLFAELDEGKKHIGRIMNEWARSQQQVCTRVPDESSGSPPQQAPESRWGSLPAEKESTCGWGSSWPKSTPPKKAPRDDTGWYKHGWGSLDKRKQGPKSTSGSPPKQAPGWGSSWPKSTSGSPPKKAPESTWGSSPAKRKRDEEYEE